MPGQGPWSGPWKDGNSHSSEISAGSASLGGADFPMLDSAEPGCTLSPAVPGQPESSRLARQLKTTKPQVCTLPPEIPGTGLRPCLAVLITV